MLTPLYGLKSAIFVDEEEHAQVVPPERHSCFYLHKQTGTLEAHDNTETLLLFLLNPIIPVL